MYYFVNLCKPIKDNNLEYILDIIYDYLDIIDSII